MSVSLFNTIKPVATEVMLTEVMAKKVVPAEELSGERMDAYFMLAAKKQGKELAGLETMAAQVKMLMSSTTLSAQAKHLAELAANMDKSLNELKLLMDLYKNRNSIQCTNLATLSEFTPEQQVILLENRNLDWINKLPQYMEARTTFIAVGAMHIPGEKGLVTQLRNKGYTVKAIATK